MRVLLADDNPVNQRLVARLLDRHGHSVVLAGDGRAAVAAVAAHRFDVALMDVQMPGLDGFEATAAIRARERETGTRLPIIAVTAHAMQGDRERCLAAGMDGYLTKPIRAEELYALLAQLRPSGGAPPDATPAADLPAALAAVDGDRGLLQELVQALLTDAPRQLDTLRAALRQGDTAQLERVTHRLQGALSTVRAMLAQSLARQLEALGRAGQLGEASGIVRQLEAELARLATFWAQARIIPS